FILSPAPRLFAKLVLEPLDTGSVPWDVDGFVLVRRMYSCSNDRVYGMALDLGHQQEVIGVGTYHRISVHSNNCYPKRSQGKDVVWHGPPCSSSSNTSTR